MRLLLGRPVPTQGRQPEILTAPPFTCRPYRFRRHTNWTETTRVCLGLRLVPLASIGELVSCDWRSPRTAEASRAGRR
jgi:hypothetical protein